MFRKQNADVTTLVSVPIVAGQRASRTDIHDLAFKDRVPIVANARKFKNTFARSR